MATPHGRKSRWSGKGLGQVSHNLCCTELGADGLMEGTDPFYLLHVGIMDTQKGASSLDQYMLWSQVCSVDASVQPPSYGIELGDHFRETEATRLAPRGSGATPPPQPPNSAASRHSGPSLPVQPSSSTGE